MGVISLPQAVCICCACFILLSQQWNDRLFSTYHYLYNRTREYVTILTQQHASKTSTSQTTESSMLFTTLSSIVTNENKPPLSMTTPPESSTPQSVKAQSDLVFGRQEDRNPPLDIQYTQHRTNRHLIHRNESSGTFSKTMEADWIGEVSPNYIFGYSAFYIDASPFRNHSIVFVGVLSKRIGQVYCVLDQFGIEHVVEGIAKTHNTFCGSKYSCGTSFWCPLPDNITVLSSNVGIKLSQNGSIVTSIPVEIPQRKPINAKSDKYRLLICLKVMYLPASYPNISTQEFIEWVELNRILGVDHISVYVMNTTLDMERVLVHVQRLNLPTTKPGRTFALNDCLYRNYYAYDRHLFIDSDEFIVPQVEDNISDMIINYETKNKMKVSSLKFLNTVYFTDLPNASKSNSSLASMAALQHVEPEKAARIKYLIDPQQCLLAFAHWCEKRIPKPNKKVIADVSVAKCQHYKKCSTARQRFNCTSLTLYNDTGLLRFKTPLESAVFKAQGDISKMITF